MAKQSGIIKLEGTIGDITFHKSKDGFIAKSKGGVSAQRIASDPAFQRTRENIAEFGRAGKAGKLLRNSMRLFLQKAADNRIVSRLTQQFMKVIQADTTSTRGNRNVPMGNCGFLQGFDFNLGAKLETTIYASIEALINRVTGEYKVDLAPFKPQEYISAPASTTHFRLFAAAIELDFENETYVLDSQETLPLDYLVEITTITNLAGMLPANSTKPLFLSMGIEFLQQVNGQMYSLGGAHNAMAIVRVDQV